MANFYHRPRNKSDGKFHLMLKFPDLDQTKGITWMQSDPFDMTTTTPPTANMECLTEYETRYGITASSTAGFVTYTGRNVGDWESCRSICKSKGAEWLDWNSDLKKCFCKSQHYWEVCVRKQHRDVTSGETTCSSEYNQGMILAGECK